MPTEIPSILSEIHKLYLSDPQRQILFKKISGIVSELERTMMQNPEIKYRYENHKKRSRSNYQADRDIGYWILKEEE